MKHYLTYDQFINESYEPLYESKFWDWLLRAGKAKRYGKAIANARYQQQKRELEMKNVKIEADEDPESFTPDEIAELKTYEDEAINMENQLETWLSKNNSSEYLRNVGKQAELEQENANIKRLRQMAVDKKQKSKYDQMQKINKTQSVLLKQDNQEFEKIVKQNKNKKNFDPDTYRDKKKQSSRQDKLNHLELQRAHLQKKDMENRVRIGELKGDTVEYKSAEAERTYSSGSSNTSSNYESDPSITIDDSDYE